MLPFLEIDIYSLIHWFFLYSFIGWGIECVVLSYENKHFTNRGFLHGPFCIIYGFGALGFYFLLSPFSENYPLLFIFGLLIASALELVTAKLMIRLFGGFWWDYSHKPYNYKGILCLESSIAWGALTILLFAFIHRAVEGLVSLYPIALGRIAAILLVVYTVIDFSYTLRRARKDGSSVLPENSLMIK